MSEDLNISKLHTLFRTENTALANKHEMLEWQWPNTEATTKTTARKDETTAQKIQKRFEEFDKQIYTKKFFGLGFCSSFYACWMHIRTAVIFLYICRTGFLAIFIILSGGNPSKFILVAIWFTLFFFCSCKGILTSCACVPKSNLD